MTCLIPARWAARVFSFRPPIGRTSPRRVISPVMARSWWTARAEIFLDAILIDGHVIGRAGHDLGGDPAGDAADAALEIAHAGLAGVAFDDVIQCRVEKSRVLLLQTIGLELTRNQIALCNI